ncbi:MAG TPA: hypothetical protein VF792_11165 [Ktedonobacterales bacterium]
MERTLLWYHLALFLHLCALLAAMSASGISHFADVRMGKARTSAELLEWATIISRAGQVFPVVLLTLVATGAYMVSPLWTWNTGWVDTAFGGVVVLFVGGIITGVRNKALQRALAGDPAAPISAQARQMADNLLTRALSYGNTGLAIGIVFIMVNKPNLLGSILSVVVAYTIGVALANMLGRSAAAAKSQVKESGAQ